MGKIESESEVRPISRALSTSIRMAGAQLVFLACGLIRSKAIAVVLGPTGLGLFTTLMSIRAMAQAFADLGASGSGVRQIAKAAADDDQKRIGDVARTLKRISFLSGLAGGALLALFSAPVSRAVFQTEEYRTEVALVGVVLFLTCQTAARRAIVQGARRVGDLAKITTISSIAGVTVAVAAVLAFGLDGVMPALIGMALVEFAVCWRYARAVPGTFATGGWRKSFSDARALISLGSAFMWTGMLVVGVELATRAMLVSQFDLAATGMFAAAYALSRLFVSLVMSAMSADFYPALTMATGDVARMRRMVIEQIEVGIALALPGLLLILALAPWLVSLLYSAEFAEASALVRWFVLGALLQVVSFPAGYILVAQGRTKLLIAGQTILSTAHLSLIAGCLAYFGIEGVAIAFLIYHTVYLVVFLIVGSRLIGLKLPVRTLVFVGGAVVALAGVFLACLLAPPLYGAALGGVSGVVAGVMSLRWMVRELGSDHRLTRSLAWMPFVVHRAGAGDG